MNLVSGGSREDLARVIKDIKKESRDGKLSLSLKDVQVWQYIKMQDTNSNIHSSLFLDTFLFKLGLL